MLPFNLGTNHESYYSCENKQITTVELFTGLSLGSEWGK